MTQIAELTVLFADLRGSTGLFEQLGNAEATSVVTHCVHALGHPVADSGGRVVKTLGDGLMAVFPTPAQAAHAATTMHEVLEAMVGRADERGVSSGLRRLRLQVALAHGEVVEMSGDCFGDAVNVAARLLDHAGDNETLVTADVLAGMPLAQRARFRSLDRLALRGRAEAVEVHVQGGRRGGGQDSAITQFGNVSETDEPNALHLQWEDLEREFLVEEMPVVVGRSPQTHFCVSDSRVSRSHARIDWHGGNFQLTDLSFNGTYVRFNDGEIVSLRRGSCILHGAGMIGLGGSPADKSTACLAFDVIRVGDTQPHRLR